MWLALLLAAPGAQAQEPLTEEEVRELYTTTSIAVAIGLPLTILNNMMGNVADETSLELSTSTTDLLELTALTAGQRATLELFIARERLAIARDVALGGGDRLDQIFALLAIPQPTRAPLARRLRARHRQLTRALFRNKSDPTRALLSVLRQEFHKIHDSALDSAL